MITAIKAVNKYEHIISKDDPHVAILSDYDTATNSSIKEDLRCLTIRDRLR